MNPVDAGVVTQVVRAHARRGRWAASIAEDLAQEAALAIEKARGTYAPERGDWRGYAYRAAYLACASYVVADASPVTRREKGGRNEGRRLEGGATAALFNGSFEGTEGARCATHGFGLDWLLAAENPEDAVGEEEWEACVRSRLLVLTRGNADVTRMLLGETTPAAVAAARGAPVRVIYAALCEARKRLRADRELLALYLAKVGAGVQESQDETE